MAFFDYFLCRHNFQPVSVRVRNKINSSVVFNIIS
nr:MAG TPA: hypothetical protein [Caudoviricetes sp.]